MKTILLAHASRYPAMEPTDAVKLLYQNTFGGGHLIRDEAAAIRYLRREYATTPRDAGAPLTEDIGNGLLRVNLAALPENRLEELGQVFLQSAKDWQGTLEDFLPKLALLRELTAAGIFGFSTEALDSYLSDYAQAGYPMVSHSERYRQAYHPAYRVVRAELFAEKNPGRNELHPIC